MGPASLGSLQSSRALRIGFATIEQQPDKADSCDEGPDALEQHEGHEVDQPGGKAGEPCAQEIEAEVGGAVGTQNLEQIDQEGEKEKGDTGKPDDFGREKTVHSKLPD
jgi:hypothetical protein